MTEGKVQYDPVDGKEIIVGTEYAEKDGLYFSSVQTQQMYYQLLEKGFEIAFQNGKPTLVQSEGKPVWTLRKDGKEGQSFRSTSEGKFVQPGLPTGEYVFKAKATASFTVNVEVTSGDGREKIRVAKAELKADSPEQEIKFTIFKKQSNATFVVEFKAHSLFKKEVKANLLLFPLAATKQEVTTARSESIAVQREGEYIVELTKGAGGVGMTLGWDKTLKAVVVKSIEENGAAKLTKRLNIGDQVRGIQGKRIQNLTFKQVIKLLRSVPRTVVLLMAKAPKGYVPSAKKTRTRILNEKKLRSKPKPPRPPRFAPEIPDGHRNSAPPPPVPAKKPQERPLPQQPPSARSPPPPPKRPSSIANTAAVPSKPAPPVRVAKAPPPVPVHRKHAPPPAVPQRSSPPPPPNRNTLSAAPPVVPQHKASPPPPVPAQRKAAPPPPPTNNCAIPPPPPPPSMNASGPIPPPPATGRNSVPPAPPAAPAQRVAPPPAPVASTSSGTPTGDFAKYEKMKKSNLPEGAIFNAWVRDGCPTSPAGFWSDAWASEVAKEAAKHQGGAVPVPKKIVVQKSNTKTGVPTKPSNPLAEIQGFNKNKLKSASAAPKAEAPSAPSNPLAAINNFDISSLKKVDRTAKQDKPAPSSNRPMNPLDELKAFNKNKLRSASTPVAKQAPKPQGGLGGAIGDALDRIRSAVGDDQEDDSDSDWNSDDDWAM